MFLWTAGTSLVICVLSLALLFVPLKKKTEQGGPGSVNIMVIFKKGFETIHFGVLKFEAAKSQEVQ